MFGNQTNQTENKRKEEKTNPYKILHLGQFVESEQNIFEQLAFGQL